MKEALTKLLHDFMDYNSNVIECYNLVRIVKDFDIDTAYLAKIIEDKGIKIKNCVAGEFGYIDNKYYSDEIYNQLIKFTDSDNKIRCEKIWELSNRFDFFDIAHTIKNSNIGVVYCIFGCFRKKEHLRLKAKTNVKMINKATGIVLDDDILRILKLIDQYGSISKAASTMNMSYKKAWGKIKLLEDNMGRIFVIKSRGRQRGGSKLTQDAKEIIEKFDKLKIDIEEFANNRFLELFYSDRLKKFKR